jgi:hypothetical protein
MNQESALIKRAVKLFPLLPYSDVSATRHARRQWVKAIQWMRHDRKESVWGVDHMKQKSSSLKKAA